VNKLPVVGNRPYSFASLAAAVALGAMTTIAASTPSVAQVAGAQSGVSDHSLIENVAYVARRGVVVGGRYRGGYRGAYVGRGGYAYRGRYGYDVVEQL
jgi:hypothetical protein